MAPESPRLFFDYVDPLCYLLEAELTEALSGDGTVMPSRVPAEVCPPPAPLLDPDGPWWMGRWHEARTLADARGLTLVEPTILPWTRKAHELVLHAREHGLGTEAHAAVFRAMFATGRDIGRVDVLVELARELGLDAQEAKAVLDVDRHSQEVDRYSQEVAALAMEVHGPAADCIPALVRGPEILRGFHNRDTLRTFLLR